MDEGDVHHRKRRLKLVVCRLKTSKSISEKNKELILRFKDECFSNGLSVDRVTFYMNRLTKVAEWLGKDFPKADKEDIKNLVRRIEQSEDYTAWTKKDYKVAIKRFYKWLEGDGETYPDKVRWIKTTLSRNNKKLPEDLLSKEDIKNLVSNAQHVRDKAMIMVLYESGCRIGELLNMKLKDVEFNRYGVKITVNGKTGSRRILLISSVPHLSNWIENHPRREQRESPLWVSIGSTNYGKRLDYQAVRKRLKEIAERAGIKKAINPHSFRHSRATHLAKELTEAQMCQYFGWIQGSKMPATYVHLSGRDLDNAILKLHGKLPEEEEENERELSTKECPRCDHENSSEMRFCGRCMLPLDPKTAMEIKDKEKEFLTLLTPEMVEKMIERKVRQIIKKLNI
jgi:site-specific recombinase XerD